MASTNFTSFILVLILLHVRSSVAQTLQDVEKAQAGKGTELEMSAAGAIAAAANKIIVQVEKGSHGAGGRRMMLKSGLSKGTEQEGAEDTKGKDTHGFKNQKKSSLLKAEPVLHSGTQKASAGPACSLPSKPVSEYSSSRSKQAEVLSSHGSFENLESQKLEEAVDEIISFMNKDYKGREHHKPPSNDAEPSSQEYLTP